MILTVLAAFTCLAWAEAKEIKGTVKTTDGEALSGVVVSDGLNTTVTDSKGRFSMEADADSRYVFISTPAGYISETLEGETLYYKVIGKRSSRTTSS